MTNLAISPENLNKIESFKNPPPIKSEYSLDLTFTKKNFDSLILECVRLRGQRIKDQETIINKNYELIALKNELIELYIAKEGLDKIEFNEHSFAHVVMENIKLQKEKTSVIRGELAAIQSSNQGAVMYINK
jgi:hypothetical protein